MADRLDFQQLSFGLKRMGWIRFWIQVVLGVVVVGVLIFNNIGGSLARNAERAVGPGAGVIAHHPVVFGVVVQPLARLVDRSHRPGRGQCGATHPR
jgi:hypothetical protein